MLKISTWISKQALQQADFWDPISFHHVSLGLLTTIPTETSFHSCYKTWIHLWSIHDGAPPHFVLAVPQFLNSVFLAQLVGPGGSTAWPALSPDLYFYI